MDENFWKDVWPLILKSPIALVTLGATYFMGYGIAFLLFGYHRESIRGWKWLYSVFGAGYTALMFAIINWRRIWASATPITIEQIRELMPQTLLLSFALLFIIMVVVITVRDRRRGG